MRKIMLAAALLLPLATTASAAEEYCHPLRPLDRLTASDSLPLDCVPDYGMTGPVTHYACKVVMQGGFGIGGKDTLAAGWDDCQPVR